MKDRTYNSATDLEKLASLAQTLPENMRQFLTSINPKRDMAVWEDRQGHLTASVIVQPSFGGIWFYFDPLISADRTAVTFWSLQRLAEESRERKQTIRAQTLCRKDDLLLQSALEQSGFERQSRCFWEMTRDLKTLPVEPCLPDGFLLRPLDSDDDFQGYCSLCQDIYGGVYSDERRQAMKAHFNLGVFTSEGGLAAFSQAFCQGSKGLLAEVLTHPAFRRQGLATAAIWNCLHHLQSVGMSAAYLDTDNPAAYDLYAKLGFQTQHIRLVYERQISPDIL